MDEQINERALKLHQELKGKISVESKAGKVTPENLPVLYTPGVGAVSSYIAAHPEAVNTMTNRANTVAIVTDGTAVLGLGNIGPKAALPVMEGKAVLFKTFAGIDAVPICLGTQDTEEIIRTVKALEPTFGGINLEDIAAPRAFTILARLRNEMQIPVLHDDQQGTAVVVLAGLINALGVRGLTLADARIVVNGAGAAGLAIASLLITAGAKHIVVTDSHGAIYKGREGMNEEKERIADVTNMVCSLGLDKEGCVSGGLTEALAGAHVFVGVSKGGVLTAELVRTMAERPIIFALANPVPEIVPDEARAGGAYIIATGRSDFPNQLNNVLAFPGIFRGAIDNGVRLITDAMLIRAAHAIAGAVETPDAEHIVPSVFDTTLVKRVADAIR